MYTVSKRAKEYKQPRGGFLPPSSFKIISLEDTVTLKNQENISPTIVGMTVDYMTRFLEGTTLEEAFKISLQGAELINKANEAKLLLKNITGLNKESIIAACKIVGFDSILRAGPITYKPIEGINPDDDTIFNIITMIKRSQFFLKNYGPIVAEGITFLGGYTPTVTTGDADFMTEDTLWDFKVSKNSLKSFQTLQIFMYYLMGCRAIKLNIDYNFKNKIKKIGIYNPRKNKIYIKEISDIDIETTSEVEKNVLGYKEGIVDPHLKKLLQQLKSR